MYSRNAAALYRLNAQECVEIARELAPARKAALLGMARHWMILALQAEKNAQASLVYETPAADRHVTQQSPQP